MFACFSECRQPDYGGPYTVIIFLFTCLQLMLLRTCKDLESHDMHAFKHTSDHLGRVPCSKDVWKQKRTEVV
jgi:hypothetical protein